MYTRTTPKVFGHAKQLHRNLTPVDARLWARLRAHRMNDIHFRNQHAIGSYVVDFCAPRKKLIIELQDSITAVKILRGLLPICASCKKVRDDKGYWNQIEQYITEHSEAVFSHGLCPDCAERIYPDYVKKKKPPQE